MGLMKYFLFCKLRSVISAGRSTFELFGHCNTFKEVQDMVEKAEDLNYECRVIYGTELQWEIETEEVVTKKIIEKSRKLKDK